MFFKDIIEWTDRKLKIVLMVSNMTYYIFTLAVPVAIIASKYDIFKKVSGYKLTGIGLILIVIIGLGGFTKLIKTINKMPENEQNERHLKFIPLMILALIIPFGIKFVLVLLKNNFTLANDTISWCIYSYCVGVVIDHIIIKYLDAERELRKEAVRSLSVDTRKNRKK